MTCVRGNISKNISFLENLNRARSRTSRYVYRDIAHVRGVSRINRRFLAIAAVVYVVVTDEECDDDTDDEGWQ